MDLFNFTDVDQQSLLIALDDAQTSSTPFPTTSTAYVPSSVASPAIGPAVLPGPQLYPLLLQPHFNYQPSTGPVFAQEFHLQHSNKPQPQPAQYVSPSDVYYATSVPVSPTSSSTAPSPTELKRTSSVVYDHLAVEQPSSKRMRYAYSQGTSDCYTTTTSASSDYEYEFDFGVEEEYSTTAMKSVPVQPATDLPFIQFGGGDMYATSAEASLFNPCPGPSPTAFRSDPSPSGYCPDPSPSRYRPNPSPTAFRSDPLPTGYSSTDPALPPAPSHVPSMTFGLDSLDLESMEQIDSHSSEFEYGYDYEYTKAGYIRKNRPIPVPIPVPNLIKKSRGRKVPTLFPESSSAAASIPAPKRATRRSMGNQRSTANTQTVRPGGERSFACTILGCGKAFVRGEHLKRHIRSIHTHEKPHVCPYERCGKAFSRRDNLSQHFRVHLA